MSSNYIFKGIHSTAQNEWIMAVTNNCQRIRDTQNMTERLHILQDLARPIKGISEGIIIKTLAEFESLHY